MEDMLDLNRETILVTGAAGFIGAFLIKKLLEEFPSAKIVGLDNLNTYYDPKLKHARLNMLRKYGHFFFEGCDLADKRNMERVFEKYQPSVVVNLAAQAGVRYSITHPDSYIHSNLVGFFRVLECCRYGEVKHLIFASSSSVYGSNKKVPYSTEDRVDKPVSLYAATKKSDELMAHAYSKLYGIPATGLRFFTVYGPMGRPDMAYFNFTNKLVRGEKISLFNYGDMRRDFTYIDDIVTGITKVMQKIPQETEDGVRYKIYNIGNNHPEKLLDFVDILERCLLDAGVITEPGERELLPMQAGDVYQTYADVDDLDRDFGFRPTTQLEDGLRRFVDWYKDYYRIETDKK